MVAILVAALVAVQGAPAPGPEATAGVDRARLRVGEELLLTIRVRTRVTAQPVRIVVPPLSGFAVVGSRDLTEVAVAADGPPVRTTTRELRLRAEWPGRRVIPSVRLEQGGRTVLLAPLTVQVDSSRGAGAEPLSALARALLELASPPDSTRGVSVSIVTPRAEVIVGEQVDLLAVAWFPRELRLRLRRAPLLQLRTPDGVWAYPQSAPAGGEAAASRLVHGRWMDLFVAHQVVFPLQPGDLRVPAADVEFALPVTYSFFSREDRYAVRSEPALIRVLPLPERGRPDDDRGVVAQDLTLEVAVSVADTRVGEPIEVTASAAGTGNVALWPEPHIPWPPGFRAYPAQTEAALAPRDGRTAGRKTFRYLVVPDSAGVFMLSARGYPYYDPAAREYRVARAAPQSVAVAPGTELRAARALPPLLAARAPSRLDQFGARLWPWGWVATALLPPLLVLVGRVRVRTRAPGGGPRASPARHRGGDRLRSLEREFQALLARHVPDPAVRGGPGLAQALRAAGLEHAVAEHVMRLRDRLRAARFGPGGPAGAADLEAELRDTLRFFDGDRGRSRRRTRPALLGLVLLLVPLAAGGDERGRQQATAEALYDAGALRAAADSFAARAERRPSVAAHWYNLGATLYRAGADGKAIAAWTRAARLAPREPLIRRARALLPPPDATSESLLAVGRATPSEWCFVAALAWVLCWAGAARRPARVVWMAAFALLAAGTALPGWAEWRRRALPLGIVLQPGTAVREAPYGGAAARGSLDGGAAVLLGRPYGGWIEVRRPEGLHGWMLRAEVTRL